MRTWLAVLCLVSLAAADDPLRYWLPANRQAQRELEARLVETVDAEKLRGYHDLLASRPHRAGSPGDLQVAASIAKVFADLGLEVEKQELWCYLATPVLGEVEIVAPDRIALPVKEKAIDAFSGHAEGSIGWNAFSGSGEATAEVVYANYGKKEDYEKLDELGVDLKGRIVIARYGGNFRGYKAKFAEARGAAGLVIYTDPYDSGYFKGLLYPEGGFANAHYIQRGSILTLPYRGDPLTPFGPALTEAPRLNPSDVPFPTLPVQPIGWGAAWEILKRMKGAAVPKGWQGALPFAYRVTGGPALRLRLKVEQKRQLTRTFNVVGTLKGARHPEQLVVVGAHHDAWGFGAGDPTSGTILVLEAARCFAEVARAGRRPARSIAFAAWAAEEYGVMGSTEWVEAHRARLRDHAVGYLNLDMAAMGPDPRSSAAPSLKQVIAEACRDEGHELKKLGNLGGGSDHMGFYCHLAIPAASLGAGGSEGVSYHSLYDNLAWYRHVVGDDYAPARMLARMVNRVLSRLASADLLPLDPVRYGLDLATHLDALHERAAQLKFAARAELPHRRYTERAREVQAALLAAVAEDRVPRLGEINEVLLGLERAWFHRDGLPARPWYRNLYAASDEDSGYAAWMLPGLRHAVEHGDSGAFRVMETLYRGVLEELHARLDRIEELRATPSPSPGARGE
ncbi:MAG: M28 family peptidase [Planctomycetota bacterium]|jgi:N-acetylated-alpha-linked acidic dipeptidase